MRKPISLNKANYTHWHIQKAIGNKLRKPCPKKSSYWLSMTYRISLIFFRALCKHAQQRPSVKYDKMCKMCMRNCSQHNFTMFVKFLIDYLTQDIHFRRSVSSLKGLHENMFVHNLFKKSRSQICTGQLKIDTLGTQNRKKKIFKTPLT